jgi:predicted nuclease with TOPRIM domain
MNDIAKAIDTMILNRVNELRTNIDKMRDQEIDEELETLRNSIKFNRLQHDNFAQKGALASLNHKLEQAAERGQTELDDLDDKFDGLFREVQKLEENRFQDVKHLSARIAELESKPEPKLRMPRWWGPAVAITVIAITCEIVRLVVTS